VEWARQVDLGVPVSGIVEGVYVEEGQRVVKGTLLMALDQTPFVAEHQRAQARSAAARAAAAEQQRAHQRAKELFDRGVSSTVELDHARLALSQANAQLEETRAAESLAGYRRERSRLLAPFNAYVVTRTVTPGQMIAAELQPPVLFVLAEYGQYLLRVNAPSSLARNLQRGSAVSVRVDDKTYPGEVVAVGAEQTARDQSESLQPVTVRFRAEDGQVLAGRRGELVFK
jgi:RND family efflux transporter MFP subunit